MSSKHSQDAANEIRAHNLGCFTIKTIMMRVVSLLKRVVVLYPRNLSKYGSIPPVNSWTSTQTSRQSYDLTLLTCISVQYHMTAMLIIWNLLFYRKNESTIF